MTNNPTIDGVSRRVCHACVSLPRSAHCSICDINAPVVERQEPFAWYTDDYLTDRSATTYDELTANRWRAKGWPVLELFQAPPQLAELQATIDQLQAQMAELHNAASDFKEYAELGWDHFPDVGVRLKAALSASAEPANSGGAAE